MLLFSSHFKSADIVENFGGEHFGEFDPVTTPSLNTALRTLSMAVRRAVQCIYNDQLNCLKLNNTYTAEITQAGAH